MINSKNNPVQWALWLDEFDEPREHLDRLIAALAAESDYDESRLRVDLGHVMAHLNRAWARRNIPRDLTDEEWESFREYPKDLQPIA